MMKKNHLKLALLMLTAVFPTGAYSDEIQARFTGISYPLQLALPAAAKDGVALAQTSFSEAPQAFYDTVLIQGSMTGPEISVDLEVGAAKDGGASAAYRPEKFRRFPNGRFWARYRVPASRLPLRLSISGRAPAAVTVYESELLIYAESREKREPGAGGEFTPDPNLSYPADGPFPIIRRAGWQASAPHDSYLPHQPGYFTLHHTQGHYPLTPEAALEEIRFIQDYHQNAKGWIDIGYHFLIDPLGNIYEGRPLKAQGAHVSGHNPSNIGISVMGSYHPPVSNVFTDASRDSLVAVARYLKSAYQVPASGFYAHRELGSTDCPGDDLYARKDELTRLIFDLPVRGTHYLSPD